MSHLMGRLDARGSRKFRILAGSRRLSWISVRDVGVAGSNPVTPITSHGRFQLAAYSKPAASCHLADRVDLGVSLRSDSLFSPTSATIWGQRALWSAEVVQKSSSGTPFKGSTPNRRNTRTAAI